MAKKSLKVFIYSLVGITTLAALGGIIYFAYYNAQVVHEKKYKKDVYEKDVREITLVPSKPIEVESAADIYQKYLEEKNNEGFDLNVFLSQYVTVSEAFKQKQNIDVTFISLNYDETKPNYINVGFEAQDANKKFEKFTSPSNLILINNNIMNIYASQQWINLLNQKMDDLKLIINNGSASDSNYFSSDIFKTKVFEWFKRLVDEIRPNLYPASEYDVVPVNGENYVTFITKNSRNLLKISFKFISKEKKISSMEWIVPIYVAQID